MRKTLALLAVVALLAGCSRCQPLPVPEPTPEPLPPEPPEPEPPPQPPVKSASCETACENQRRLGCELGEPTPEGHSCEDVCANLAAGPIESIKWDVACLSESSRCEDC